MSDTFLKETAGETLQGVIDGSNMVYMVSFDFNADSVNIYVNGRLKIRDWDDGFWVIPPRTVKLKEPLEYGDSLEVEYKANIQTGGGAEGGRPNPPSLGIVEPGMQATQNLPAMRADEVKPGMDASGVQPGQVVPATLRPVIIRPDSAGDGSCP